MGGYSRRDFFSTLAACGPALLLQPVRALAEQVGGVRIRNIEIFPIEIPIPREDVQRGRINRYTVARVETDAGVRGYSFAGPPPELLDRAIRPALVGSDLFALEDHLKGGLLEWGGLEHALWDAIGKLAGQPVYRLLGGHSDRVKAYLTCVWKGNSDQSQVSYKQQADLAVKISNAGFKGMKIRVWRPNPLHDADECREIRAAVGPDFAIMFDRTAHAPVQAANQKIWDYDTGLRVARALQRAGAY